MNATALTANRPTAADARVLADVVAAPFEKLRVPSWARHAALVVLGSWLVAGLAQLVIPMGLVPITGQTLGVLLVGALLGSRRGAAALVAYLAQGAAGLPVFAGAAAGPAVLMGPTAGYLFAFVPAAFLVGLLAERGWDKRTSSTLLAMTLATAVIFIGGLAWLGTLAASGALQTAAADPAPGITGLQSLLAAGFYPFLPGAVIKALIATTLLPMGWEAVRWIEGRR